jgi:16S rRNA (cytidine1402-2'-O)-methyltransferase
LGDFSTRAVEVLKECDIVLAEDTRTAHNLFNKMGIHSKRVESYHDHSDDNRRLEIIKLMDSNRIKVTLISEAGTPCVSDPGYKLIRDARANGFSVFAVPGASALLTLAACSGLPTDRLLFIGFLSHKDSAVRKEFESWNRYVGHSIVFYDSMRRLKRDLEILHDFHPTCSVAIGRELTKLYEETITGSPADLLQWISQKTVLKGEVSVMVYLNADCSKPMSSEDIKNRITEEAGQRFREGARLKELLGEFKDRGLNRTELYSLLLTVKAEMSHSD